jgi:hypothetical protein
MFVRLFLSDNLENLRRRNVCNSKLLECSCKFINVHDNEGRRRRRGKLQGNFMICQIRLGFDFELPISLLGARQVVDPDSRDSSWEVTAMSRPKPK